jgi:N-methylhydantoinase B
MPIPPGDCVVIEYNGGGGYGDPLEREPALVARDIADGKVSVEAATRHYGVVLMTDGTVDETGTSACRAEAVGERLATSTAPPGPPTEEPIDVVLAGVAGGVDLARTADGRGLWCCGRCSHPLGDADEDFARSAAVRTLAPQELDGYMYVDPKYFGDPDVRLRQFFCPACGRLLGQEFCHAGDEPHLDCRIEGVVAP